MRSCRGFSPRTYSVTLEQWTEFYRLVFPPAPEESLTFYGPHDPTMDDPFTVEEVIKHINVLKLGKAPGEDQVSNEFIKNLPSNWILYTTVLFNKLLEGERFPLAWGNVVMTMLFKKGDKTDPSNYRGIALINSITKLFTSILKSRLQTWAHTRKIIPECQTGFVPDKCCLDNTFVLMASINQQLRLSKRKVYALFVDYKRAFDSVNHKKILIFLYELGVSSKFLRILANMYAHANLRVRQGPDCSERIEITEGVLQGEILSPLLFILFLSDLESFFRARGARGISIDAFTDVLVLLYADDIVFLSENAVRAQKVLDILDEYVKAKGLTANVNKTQMVICKPGRPPKLTKPFLFDGKEIVTVPE